MRKYLILALLLAAFTGSDAFAQGWGYGGGADAWASRHNRNLEMNDDGRNGADGNPPVWMRRGGYYGGQGYYPRGGYYPRPMGGGWRGGYVRRSPPLGNCIREALPPVINTKTGQMEPRLGVGSQEMNGIRGIWYENPWYPGPAHIFLEKLGCYMVMDKETYSMVWRQLQSGDPAQKSAAFHQIMEAAREQGIPVIERASAPPVEYND